MSLGYHASIKIRNNGVQEFYWIVYASNFREVCRSSAIYGSLESCRRAYMKFRDESGNKLNCYPKVYVEKSTA